MQPANMRESLLASGAYEALRSLLDAVRQSVGAGQVCLVSPSGEPECVTLVSVEEPEGDSPAPYVLRDEDITLPALFRGEEVARLVVSDVPSTANTGELQGFAHAVGYMLGQAQEAYSAQRALEESRIFQQMSLQFGEQTELRHLLDSAVQGVRKLTRADYADLCTIDEDGTRHWLAMDGFRTDIYERETRIVSTGLARRIMTTRKSVTLHGIGTDPSLRPEDFPVHIAEGGVSVMAVPLMVRGQPVGALTLGSRTERQWSQSEIQLASVVANGAAMAIEQVRASRGERAQRAFLERMIEEFPGVLVVTGPPPEWRIALANNRFKEGLPEPYRNMPNVTGLTAQDLGTDRDGESAAAMRHLLARVFETGEAISFDQYETEADGADKRYWNWTAVPVDHAGPEGERVVMLIAHDITDTVRSRQEAQRSAALARARAEELEAVITHMADGIVIFDSSGEVVRINPAGQALLGREMVSGTLERHPAQYGLYTEAGQPFEAEQLPSSRALKGEVVLGETMMVHKPSGDQTILRVSCAPLAGSGGEIEGAVAVFHDVTQEKIVERLKDEFLSIVSHELRTPLTAIIGYSDLMLRGVHGGLVDRQAKVLNAVRANADRLLRLINDLLDVSRLESGAVQLYAEPVDIGEIASRIITHTRILATNAGVEVVNWLPERHLNKVLADETKLQQVLENLIANAIKFSPGGTVTIDAYQSPLLPDDPRLMQLGRGADVPGDTNPRSVVVSVRDTGAGLDPEQLDRIWDRFYQADTTVKRQSGGAGLGLTIVRSLVELHGGEVWASSAGRDRGSVFSFSMPVVAGQYASVGTREDRPQVIERLRPRGEDRPVLGTVLVAEDDADQREIICDMLELEGFHVVLAQTGDEAIELAREVRPSAIALDVILPRRDGWEVLQQLRRDPDTRDIPVLVISVVDQAEFGKQLGADEYLLKPLDPTKLRTIVRKLVSARRGQTQEQEAAGED